MRRRDYHLYGRPEDLARYADEYRWIGRAVKRPEPEHLIVLSVNQADLTKNKVPQ